jgi:hypothetical protein
MKIGLRPRTPPYCCRRRKSTISCICSSEKTASKFAGMMPPAHGPLGHASVMMALGSLMDSSRYAAPFPATWVRLGPTWPEVRLSIVWQVPHDLTKFTCPPLRSSVAVSSTRGGERVGAEVPSSEHGPGTSLPLSGTRQSPSGVLPPQAARRNPSESIATARRPKFRRRKKCSK